MKRFRMVLMAALPAFLGVAAWAQEPQAAPAPAAPKEDLKVTGELRDKTLAAMNQAAAFLLAAQQNDGGWMLRDKSDPAVTALVVKALIQLPSVGPKHAAVERAVRFILRYVHADGGIYVDDAGLNNYYTSVAMMALVATNDPAYEPIVRQAQDYLRKLQWDEGENYDKDHPWHGGQGYGNGKRPDLSNTQMMVEALRESGLSREDPVYQKAVAFVSRCQMLGETNDRPFAAGSKDGGFIYSPNGEGESKAGTEMVEGKPRLRSYGSMTYAGFKSLLYAGVGRDDPRIKAAYEWIQRNYTLERNPNMPGEHSLEGLFYFYHVFAKAMRAWGEDVIVDLHGRKHAWRVELCEMLLKKQLVDGSWVNEKDRWFEGNPNLVTSYALLALEEALRP